MKLSLFAYFCRDYYTALAGEKDKRLKFTPEGVCCEEGWEVRRHIVVEEETIRFCVSIKNITKEARCLVIAQSSVLASEGISSQS